MASILEAFGELGISISPTQITKLEKYVIHWTLRKTHPIVLGGIALAVDPIAFTPGDRNTLFDIFHVREADVLAAIHKCPKINRSFAVTSDPFNLLCIWLVHLASIYIKNERVRRDFCRHLLLLFHFKVFSSVVNNSWRVGANSGVMDATINSLTKKTDVIRLGSWRAVIDMHVDKAMDPNDRFYNDLVTVQDDDLFLRRIGELQTQMRSKLVTFAQAYYEVHAAGDRVKSISAVNESADGEKILAQTASVIDSATAAMVAEILNPNMFINDGHVKDIANMYSNVSFRLLKQALLKLNEMAVIQSQSRTFDKVRTDKEGVVYEGIRALILEIIRSSIRMGRTRRIDMGNQGKFFTMVKDAYTSSRTSDPDVLAIRRSIALLIDPLNLTVNEASKATLRIAIVGYIVYRMILKMKH